MNFSDFNLHSQVLDALFYMGFNQPTPIQEMAIPHILAGKDLLASAQTGTGKTAAFVLPVLNHLANKPSENIDTIILVPTRELALQIDQQIQGFSYFVGASSIALYGGGDGAEFHEQRKAIKNGVNIIVATPGKLISHLNMGYVKLDHLKHFILDEADRMLDMGFIDDIKRIIKYLPEHRQNMLFSATMPPLIKKLTTQLLKNEVHISLSVSKPAEGVKQLKYFLYENQKIALIQYLLDFRSEYQSIIIFCSTKKKVFELENQLKRKKLNVRAISSDLQQREREEVLLDFRSRRVKILVATDVLSRGIDIKDINLVVNFDVPADAEDYVHRIGRTARAETKGEAISLVSPEEWHKILRIEKLIESTIEQPPLPDELGGAPEIPLHHHSNGRRNGGKPPFKGNRSKNPSHKNGNRTK